MRQDQHSTGGRVTRRKFLKASLGAVAAPRLLSATPSPAESPGQRFFLVKPDRPLPLIVRGREDKHAAQVLASTLKRLTGNDFTVTEAMPNSGAPVILVGSAGSNQAVADFLAREPLGKKLQPEGFLLKTIPGSTDTLLLAGAERVGTIYAVHELINFYLEARDMSLWVPPLSILENPALKYRIFWTWDCRTNWELGVPGMRDRTKYIPYTKPPETFLKDYKKVVDYMSAHKLNGLIIWGFLRDSHGGVKAAQELLDYAHERGVRILPGVGSSYYGGFYFEGDNRFNVTTWLSQNPSNLRFLDRYGRLLPGAICPSKPANQQWLREGAEWFFKTFPNMGGVNLEQGDYMACQTEDCKRARARPENDPNYYWDMMKTQVPIIEVGSAINPQAWFIYATYTGFSESTLWKFGENWREVVGETSKDEFRGRIPRFVEQYPERAVCQWQGSMMLSNPPGAPCCDVSAWPKGLRPPTHHSTLVLTYGGPNLRHRYEAMVETIRYTAQRVFEEGLEGFEIYGEVSPTSPSNELNYLALEDFCWHPHRSMAEFIDQRLSRFYGSKELARRFVEMVSTNGRTPQELRRCHGEALELAEDRSLALEQRARWGDLARRFATAMP